MIPIVDPAITRGMNTVDDPKLLKPGECVRLLNAFPGNPPRPRNGCTGLLLAGSSTSLRYLPPGIAFNYNDVIYVVTWIYDGINSDYDISTINVATGAFNGIGAAEFAASTSVLFDLLELHSCIYSSVSHVMTHWKSSDYGVGSNHKVVESNLVVRDLCISEAGIIASHALTLLGGTLNPGKWVEYAFQYVRRNDAAAFEAGGTPTNILLPPNITADYKPKRIDTFLPGICIGVEDIAQRHTVEIIETLCTPTAGMLSTGAGAEAVGNFSAANAVDGTPASGVAFDVDSATAGAWVKIDYGASVTRCLTKLDVYTLGAGSTNNFKLQYSDDAATWVDGSISTVLAAAGWNTITGTSLTAHRYWRLYLVDSGTGTIDFTQIRAYGKSGVTFTMRTDSYIAYLNGATHLRVSRSLEQNTEALAQGATKFFLMDLPVLESATPTFDDTTSNTTLEGETNQLITGYSVAPPAAFIEYLKGRLYLMAVDGKVYFSETVGGDGGTDIETAQAYPQAWTSLFKPTTYLLDCDFVDGQQATGMKRLGDDIFFWKERKIFAIFGGDPTSTPLSQVSNIIGCAFPYTLTKCEIKGMFGKCILFLGNDGPMIMEEGGRVRPFSEFKIKQLWPEYSQELYSELDTDYDWIIHNCTAAFFKNTWWILYQTKAGTSRIFGYYFDPDLATGEAPNGPLEFQFASM
jgi:hypothetical protein